MCLTYSLCRTKIPCIYGETVCATPDAAAGDTVKYSKVFDKAITVSGPLRFLNLILETTIKFNS